MTILIRADANTEMGTGHLMRCLALAQAWQAEGGEAIFITACDSEGLLQRIQNEGFHTVELDKTYPDPDEWDMTSQVLAKYPDAWVVLDGYHFKCTYQKRIKDAGHPLLVIDDMAHLDQYYADVIVNQNIHAQQLHYSCEMDTQLLLGTDYVLLRREFWCWKDWKRNIPEVARKLLITLGGADPENQTVKIMHALQQVDVEGLEATVVAGGSNPHYKEIESAIRHSPSDIRLVRNVSNMPELMAWADLAVTAGGTTCWEIAFMGLPDVLLVLADNQQGIAEGLNKAGVAVKLGWYEEVTSMQITETLSKLIRNYKQRQQISTNGQKLVDGKGGERVVTTMVGE